MHESADKMHHKYSRTTSALQPHAKKGGILVWSLPPDNPLPSFQCLPLLPHPQPCSSVVLFFGSERFSKLLGSQLPTTPVNWAATEWTQGEGRDCDVLEVTQAGMLEVTQSAPPASSPWTVMARSSGPAGQQSAAFLEYTSSWTGCVCKYNHPQISSRLGYRTAFWWHALQSSLEGSAGGSAALSAHDPFWLSSRIMTPAAWVI